MTFKLDNFITECKSASQQEKPTQAIYDLVKDAVNSPDEVMAELGKPERAALGKLYVADNLTILNVVWAPKMTLMPHNHSTWAIIGVYSGREDNIFWRRIKGDENGRIEAAGAKSIAAGHVAKLGSNIVHSVTNPTSEFTAAIHVYGANFFEVDRSEWDPMSLNESAWDADKAIALFEAENALLEWRNSEESTA